MVGAGVGLLAGAGVGGVGAGVGATVVAVGGSVVLLSASELAELAELALPASVEQLTLHAELPLLSPNQLPWLTPSLHSIDAMLPIFTTPSPIDVRLHRSINCNTGLYSTARPLPWLLPCTDCSKGRCNEVSLMLLKTER